METIALSFAGLATIALGLMTGALVAEGAILVPFWRSSPPAQFLAWYKEHAALLQGFFGPLEIAATLLTLAAAALGWIADREGRALLTASALLCVAVLAVFPLYFQRANSGFAAGATPPEAVADELRRWSAWHRARTVMSLAAFGAAVVAVATW